MSKVIPILIGSGEGGGGRRDGGVITFPGGGWKRESLQILDHQRLASLLWIALSNVWTTLARTAFSNHGSKCFRKGELGEQGWRSGESTRLPPMWPGFESWRRRHMWVEFVVVFLRVLRFSPLLKTNTFKFQFDLERTDTFQRVLMNSLVLRG